MKYSTFFCLIGLLVISYQFYFCQGSLSLITVLNNLNYAVSPNAPIRFMIKDPNREELYVLINSSPLFFQTFDISNGGTNLTFNAYKSFSFSGNSIEGMILANDYIYILVETPSNVELLGMYLGAQPLQSWTLNQTFSLSSPVTLKYSSSNNNLYISGGTAGTYILCSFYAAFNTSQQCITLETNNTMQVIAGEIDSTNNLGVYASESTYSSTLCGSLNPPPTCPTTIMYLVDLVTFQVINSSAIREPQVPIMGSYFDNNVFVATFYTSTGLLIRQATSPFFQKFSYPLVNGSILNTGIIDIVSGSSYVASINPIIIAQYNLSILAPQGYIPGFSDIITSLALNMNDLVLYMGTFNGTITPITMQAPCNGACQNGGQCIYGSCQCTEAYEGYYCTIPRQCQNFCSNRGQCINLSCVCNTPYIGPDCSLINCTTACVHGVCNNQTGQCVCNPLYTGSNCSSLITPLPNVFGLDYVGYGFDIRQIGLNAFKSPVVNLNFTQGKTFIYPSLPDIVMAVPDQVDVLPVSQIKTKTTFAYSKNQDLENTAFGLGLSYSGLTFNLNYDTTNFDSSSSILIKNTATNTLYQLLLKTVVPSDQINADYNAQAATLTSSAALKLWANYFINQYGTHYIKTVSIGGKIEANAITSNNLNIAGWKLGIGLNFRSGQQYAGISFSLSETTTTASANSISEMKVVGGTPDVGAFVAGAGDFNAQKETMNTWLQSLNTGPAAAEFHLEAIYKLFSDKIRRWFLCVVYEETIGIPNANRTCIEGKNNG